MLVDSNYADAKLHFDSAFLYYDTVNPFVTELLEYAECLLYLGDTASAYKAALQSVKSGNIYLNEQVWFISQFPIRYQDSIRWQSTLLTEQYFRSLPDITGYYQLKLLEQQDQDVRLWESAIKDQSFDSLLAVTDSLNIVTLVKLTRERNINPDCILLYHLYGSRDSLFDYFDSIQHRNVIAGKTDPGSYAQWVDRQLLVVRHAKLSRYGQWIDFGDTILPDVEDPENLDRRREQIGLCPIANQARLWRVMPPRNWTAIQK